MVRGLSPNIEKMGQTESRDVMNASSSARSMTLRAIAFHEAISYEKLEEIFKADHHALFGGSLAGACSRCNLKFGVFFPAKDDPQNSEHLARLNEMIANDCKGGKHLAEYVFVTKP
jgi:hypothetical protein